MYILTMKVTTLILYKFSMCINTCMHTRLIYIASIEYILLCTIKQAYTDTTNKTINKTLQTKQIANNKHYIYNTIPFNITSLTSITHTNTI